MFKGKAFGIDCIHSIISRLWREAVGCLAAGMNMAQLCKDSEPRPPKTTEALMYGWPPQVLCAYDDETQAQRAGRGVLRPRGECA